MTEASHPPNAHLESYAAGDRDAGVKAHLAGCADCASYVSELEAGASEFGANEADAFVAKMSGVAEIVSPPTTKSEPAPIASVARPTDRKSNVTFVQFARRISPILAVAAAFLLLARWNDWIAPGSTSQISSGQHEPHQFKGGMQVAVVRERAQKQDRLVGDVAVAPNDRVRLEVSLDREQPVSAGILEDDGTWTTLIAPASLAGGTHFSEKAARFDEHPTNGLILIGAPDAVARARASKQLEGVIAIPIHPEKPAPAASGAP